MKALVTGGGGFLGGAIVRQLLDRGDTVRTYSRGDYPELAKLGVDVLRGDIADAAKVEAAVEGCDTVFHVAGRPGVWGPYAEYHSTNVTGTENVIQACRKHGVPRLVHTSSPSVTFTGADQDGIDETAPYPTRFLSHYLKTKTLAERAVLQANGPELATVALRPHLIWGPNDTQLTPRLIERAKAGRVRIVGDGKKRVDAVYIDNAAQAHLLAADRLEAKAACAGRAYNITNDEPLPMAEVLNRILEAAGVPPIDKRIPTWAAYAAGATLELVYTLLRKTGEPPMTRFVALQLATAHWYDQTAAKRDLGYHPAVTMDEGFRRLARSFGTELASGPRSQ